MNAWLQETLYLRRDLGIILAWQAVAAWLWVIA